ncbi:hypothetical protein HK102_006483 [Quaeritorhiza haematococci]|nr:hypothetical protein HK102_006483 [Quaeritorhiza haematococci]
MTPNVSPKPVVLLLAAVLMMIALLEFLPLSSELQTVPTPPQNQPPLTRISAFDNIAQSLSAQSKKFTSQRRLAYAFYATNDNYACAAMGLAQSIEDAGGRADPSSIDFVVMYTPGVSDQFVQKMKDFGFKMIPVRLIQNGVLGPGHSTWGQSVTKLQVFTLTQYERIIMLDADALALKNMDVLFDLPKYFLYAPRAYWLSDKLVSSMVMVIEPSEKVYNEQIHFFIEEEKKGNVYYDMDVINAVFKTEVAVLPATSAVLNGEFTRPGSHPIGKIPFVTVEDLADNALLAHFSEGPFARYGKPWDVRDMGGVIVPKDSHPMFAHLYRRWYGYRDQFCL